MAFSIYKTCDTIEGLEESLNALRYMTIILKIEIIYLVMEEKKKHCCLNLLL
jgi:hypothetical protein